MRKDLQKRLFVTAAVLDKAVKLADGAEKAPFWQKFIPKIPMKGPESGERPIDKDKGKAGPEMKKDEAVPAGDVANFLKGGPLPIEIETAFGNVAKALSSVGAVSGKDAKNVVLYLTKMLKKYIGGQKLARTALARKVRLAGLTETGNFSKVAVLTEDNKVSISGYHYELAPGGDPKNDDSWTIETGDVSGKYKGEITIDGANCVMFGEDGGDVYAALRQNVTISEPDSEGTEEEACGGGINKYTAMLKKAYSPLLMHLLQNEKDPEKKKEAINKYIEELNKQLADFKSLLNEPANDKKDISRTGTYSAQLKAELEDCGCKNTKKVAEGTELKDKKNPKVEEPDNSENKVSPKNSLNKSGYSSQLKDLEKSGYMDPKDSFSFNSIKPKLDQESDPNKKFVGIKKFINSVKHEIDYLGSHGDANSAEYSKYLAQQMEMAKKYHKDALDKEMSYTAKLKEVLAEKTKKDQKDLEDYLIHWSKSSEATGLSKEQKKQKIEAIMDAWKMHKHSFLEFIPLMEYILEAEIEP